MIELVFLFFYLMLVVLASGLMACGLLFLVLLSACDESLTLGDIVQALRARRI